MRFDLFTLLIVSQLVCGVCGLLFLTEAIRDKSAHSRWFACAFMVAPMASAFYIPAANYPGLAWGFPFGNGLATTALALTWVGARSFNGRTPRLWIALLGPWVMVASTLAFERDIDAWTGAVPFMLTFSAYCFLAAREFWHGPKGAPRLRNGMQLAATCTFNGTFYLCRAVALLWLGHEHPVFLVAFGPEAAALVLLLLVIVSSFSLIALGKERSELAIKHAATHDDLTDLLNRREFTRRAEDVLGRAPSARTGAVVLLVDLDHFKTINDRHGHATGDRVLIAFARIARDCLRPNDFIGRYGGEEFAIMLPGTTPEQGVEIADRIRNRFSNSSEGPISAVKPTISVGVASTSIGFDLDALITRADHALYRSKTTGRNRVTLAESANDEPYRLAS